MSKVAERIPKWVVGFLLPELRNLIKEGLKDFRAYVDDRFKVFEDRFKAFDDKLTSFRNEVGVRFDSLEKRLNIIERVVVFNCL